jgi:hypothetical protein
VRVWGRLAFATVSVVTGLGVVFVALLSKALAEDGPATDTTLIVVLGCVSIAFGVATAFNAWAALPAGGTLAAVFLLAYSGEIPDDVAYELVTGPALLLLAAIALLSRRGGGGTRRDRPASPAAPEPPAPSGAPSTPAAEPPRRTPPP